LSISVTTAGGEECRRSCRDQGGTEDGPTAEAPILSPRSCLLANSHE
jgi:hypothetical protein